MHGCPPFLAVKQVSTAVPKARVPQLSYSSELLLMHQVWIAAVLFETKHLTDHQFPHFCYTAVVALEFYNETDWETD